MKFRDRQLQTLETLVSNRLLESLNFDRSVDRIRTYEHVYVKDEVRKCEKLDLAHRMAHDMLKDIKSANLDGIKVYAVETHVLAGTTHEDRDKIYVFADIYADSSTTIPIIHDNNDYI